MVGNHPIVQIAILSLYMAGSTGKYGYRKCPRRRLHKFPPTTGQIRRPHSPSHPDYWTSSSEENSDNEAVVEKMNASAFKAVDQEHQQTEEERDISKTPVAQNISGHVEEKSTCRPLRPG